MLTLITSLYLVYSLEALLEGVTIENLLPPEEVEGCWIAENAETAKNSQQETLMQQLDGVRSLPNWIHAAMKTLMSCKLNTLYLKYSKDF